MHMYDKQMHVVLISVHGGGVCSKLILYRLLQRLRLCKRLLMYDNVMTN